MMTIFWLVLLLFWLAMADATYRVICASFGPPPNPQVFHYAGVVLAWPIYLVIIAWWQ